MISILTILLVNFSIHTLAPKSQIEVSLFGIEKGSGGDQYQPNQVMDQVGNIKKDKVKERLQGYLKEAVVIVLGRIFLICREGRIVYRVQGLEGLEIRITKITLERSHEMIKEGLNWVKGNLWAGMEAYHVKNAKSFIEGVIDPAVCGVKGERREEYEGRAEDWYKLYPRVKRELEKKLQEALNNRLEIQLDHDEVEALKLWSEGRVVLDGEEQEEGNKRKEISSKKRGKLKDLVEDITSKTGKDRIFVKRCVREKIREIEGSIEQAVVKLINESGAPSKAIKEFGDSIPMRNQNRLCYRAPLEPENREQILRIIKRNQNSGGTAFVMSSITREDWLYKSRRVLSKALDINHQNIAIVRVISDKRVRVVNIGLANGSDIYIREGEMSIGEMMFIKQRKEPQIRCVFQDTGKFFMALELFLEDITKGDGEDDKEPRKMKNCRTVVTMIKEKYQELCNGQEEWENLRVRLEELNDIKEPSQLKEKLDSLKSSKRQLGQGCGYRSRVAHYGNDQVLIST